MLFASAIGENRVEVSISTVIGFFGLIVSDFLGGWDIALKILIYLMVADYITGVLGAIKNKNVNSETMFWGGIRKGIVLAVIVIAVLLDQLVGNGSPIFRTITIYFYASREGLSLIENFGVLGVSWPPAIKNVLEQLKQKGEGEK